MIHQGLTNTFTFRHYKERENHVVTNAVKMVLASMFNVYGLAVVYAIAEWLDDMKESGRI